MGAGQSPANKGVGTFFKKFPTKMWVQGKALQKHQNNAPQRSYGAAPLRMTRAELNNFAFCTFHFAFPSPTAGGAGGIERKTV